MSRLTKDEKFRIILERFENSNDNIVDIYDEVLRERLGPGAGELVSHKTVDRAIEEFIENCKGCARRVENRRRKTYQLITPANIIKEFLDGNNYKKHYENMGILLEMLRDDDPKLFAKLEKSFKPSDIYLFKGSPFEDIKNVNQKKNFEMLVRCIENRDYIKLFFGDKPFDNLRPIKLIFMENNWYLAHVDSKDILRFSRLSFIKKVEYASKANRFQLTPLEEYFKFLEKDLQNSLTLYGKEPKEAKIKALPAVARYFKDGMKKFLSSQKFEEELEDGSVIFSLKYTQELEVLRLVQQWLPDLVILEPQELQDTYIKKLQTAKFNHENRKRIV